MAEPAMPRDNYYAVDLDPDKEYLWCACGYSKTQPFCDGSHQGTEFQPKMVKVGEAMTLYLCGCKRTQDPPYCDGMHALI